jgi:hypothetical protein
VADRDEVAGGLRDEERRTLLDQSAVALGEAWARRSREILSAEGRRAIGGWPGTMSEARARTRDHLATEPVRRQLGRVGDQEIEQAARVTYARAREVWLAGAEREDDTELAEPPPTRRKETPSSIPSQGDRPADETRARRRTEDE